VPITDAELGKIIAAVEKKKLGVTIHRGDEAENVYRIPFRSPNINYATEGGLPIGRFSLFWGGESSYKSRAAYEAMAQAQDLAAVAEESLMPRIRFLRALGLDGYAKQLEDELQYIQETWPDGMEIAFYNCEQQWDKKWAAKLGVDVHRIILVNGQAIEDIVDTMEGTYDQIEMHVIDSTSNAASILELNKKKTDSLYAPDARAWKRSIRDSMVHFNPERNVGLLINQASTRVSGPGAGGSIPVSTRYLMHTSSMTLRFERGQYLYMQDGVLKTDKPDGADKLSLAGRVEPGGVEIFATVQKSRVCRPFRVAALHARVGAREFDHYWEMFNAGVHYGIIEKSGSWFRVKGEEKNIGQGEKAVIAHLKSDVDLCDQIYARLMYELIREDVEEMQKKDEAQAA
jgi:RecA/RadA recombinase